MGFSATLGSFLFSLADTGLIIAYVRGLGQILVIYLTPFFPLSYQGEGEDRLKRGAKPLLDTRYGRWVGIDKRGFGKEIIWPWINIHSRNIR